jgi:hypothetical protein
LDGLLLRVLLLYRLSFFSLSSMTLPSLGKIIGRLMGAWLMIRSAAAERTVRSSRRSLASANSGISDTSKMIFGKMGGIAGSRSCSRRTSGGRRTSQHSGGPTSTRRAPTPRVRFRCSVRIHTNVFTPIRFPSLREEIAQLSSSARHQPAEM